jgi:multisubunit Na+/H+ antiporter MnhC subunit
MISPVPDLFWSFAIFIILLAVAGIYSLLLTRNLIRALIAVELLIKAVTLLIIVCGYISGHESLTQGLVITVIVIEVVIMTVAVGVVLGLHRHSDSLDTRKIRNLKG